METKKYTIEELAELTGYTRRTIRYYVQEGLVDSPDGQGRGGFYCDSHMKRLLQIKALQQKGMSISAIASLREGEAADTALVAREVMIRYEITPGVELNISRALEVREPRKVNEIIRVLKAIAKGEKEDEGLE